MTNTLYYGDNLDVLRAQVASESVDLIYLDPPFNSDATYDMLFKEPGGQRGESRIEAFQDTWTWGSSAARAFDEVIHSNHSDVAVLLKAMNSFLRQSDLMAYLAIMAVRLIELHRVLKPTGSLYLHCDPTTSHYLRVLLDSIFSPDKPKVEVIWQRTNAHNFKSAVWGRSHDTLLYYSRSDKPVFHPQYMAYGAAQLSRYKTDAQGRRYKAENLTFSTANARRQFEWRGTRPPPNRSWGASLDQLEAWFAAGRILVRRDGTPRLDGLKVYLDDMPGKPAASVWTDIERVGNTSAERLGYPTQKPLLLLERIIQASSDLGDLVLDPFCGCGTAIHAAEKLGRRWIGIDITHLAISLSERRLKDAFPSIRFDVEGTPRDFGAASDLARRDRDQFQWWAVSLVDGVPRGGHKNRADRGIDGIRWVRTGPNPGDIAQVIVSVNGCDNVGVAMLRDLAGVVEREGAAAGLMITLAEPTREMSREAAAAGCFESGLGRYPKLQVCTVRQILAGGAVDLPPLGRGEGFRRAPRETARKPTQSGLDL
jgi:site-specific DNA-methyltransferase (adenine-specific)